MATTEEVAATEQMAVAWDQERARGANERTDFEVVMASHDCVGCDATSRAPRTGGR